MPLIEALPRHAFSWGFNLYNGGELLTAMDMTWMGEGGSFEWEGARYILRRESLWAGVFSLRVGEHLLASATKGRTFLRRFLVRFQDRELTLESISPLTRRFQLIEAGQVVGFVTPRHPFTRKCTVDFPEDLPIPLQVFLFWLVVLLWRRFYQSAATS